MAVPKRKLSKSRSRKRYAHYTTAAPALSTCSHCHELKMNHRVCLACGYYNGIQRIEIATKK
ncbi:MAG: 50S ribosomal protein L32 [Firmicutes bacterium]|nr:50S ribosomal protein L32 [Bacillota bacterium]MCL1953133.1 50S ribosomal protein L32 [Bacillota bacterium]